MKEHSAFYRWFWFRPVFRNLRPRLMTMILALVLPLSITTVILSIASVRQGAQLTRSVSENGFLSYMDRIAVRIELGDPSVGTIPPVSPRCSAR